MKKVFVLLLVILVFMLKALSQNVDTLQNGPTCFMIAHTAVKANTKNVSESFCIGDKVKVKLKDNQLVRGTLVNLSRDSIISIDRTEIDLKAIQWIAKIKKGTGTAIVGSLITAAGVVTLATFQVDISSNEIPAQFFVGLGLVAIGVAVLTSQSKFNVKSEDQMIYKD